MASGTEQLGSNLVLYEESDVRQPNLEVRPGNGVSQGPRTMNGHTERDQKDDDNSQEDRYKTNDTPLNRIQDSNYTERRITPGMSNPNHKVDPMLNQTLPNSTVNLKSNKDITDDRNGTLETNSRKTNLRVKINTKDSNNDTEADAKPLTAISGTNSEGAFFDDSPKADSKIFSPESNKYRELEGCILRPKDQYDQPLTAEKLVDVVIVYAKSDYIIACNYKEYLERIAKEGKIDDIKVALYTREDFPSNDVKVVEDVVNRSMRVAMLLSANFGKEVNLTFIKEEMIGLTLLQEYPPEVQMSLFATEIVNRKKDAVRPVHTVHKSKRWYKTPVGLSVLRAFEFFDNNKNFKYEDDMTASFLKQARTDRKKHAEDLAKHQSFNNPNVVENMEQGKADQYYHRHPGPYDKGSGDEMYNVFSEKDRTTAFQSVPPESSFQSTSNYTESLVVCESKQVVQNPTQKSRNTTTSINSSGFVSGDIGHESVIMGPTKQECQSVNKQHTLKSESLASSDDKKTRSKTETTKSELSGDEGQGDYQTQKDVETDASSSLVALTPLSLMDEPASIVSQEDSSSKRYEKANESGGVSKEINTTDKGNIVETNLTEISVEKLKGRSDDEVIKCSTLNHSGPPARSGIRTGATPGYNEYMAGVPRAESGSQGTRQPTHVPPQGVPMPPLPHPVVTTAQSVHYHYHYADGPTRQDLDTDQGPQSRQLSTLQNSSSSTRPLQQPTTVASGPVFNIQGCGTIQIGDYNTVAGNQNVKGTNRIGQGMRGENHVNQEQVTTLAGHSDGAAIEEERVEILGDPQNSLNDLSSGNGNEKVKEDLSRENSDDENYEFFKKKDNITSDENDNNDDDDDDDDDFSVNLSTSFTDKKDTEKLIEVGIRTDEKGVHVEKASDPIPGECPRDLEQTMNALVVKGGSCCQFTLSDGNMCFTELSAHLRTESRKTGRCIQFHFNKSEYSVINTDLNDYSDDLD